MICPSKGSATSSPEHLVRETLREIVAQEIRVELVGPEEEARWNKLVRKHHYLKEHRLVGESLRYVAKQNGRWIALLGWSSAAFHLRPRDAWIGWTDAQRNAARHLMACNARFAILTAKGQSPNLASHLLSLNLKRLSEDWQQHYEHPTNQKPAPGLGKTQRPPPLQRLAPSSRQFHRGHRHRRPDRGQ